GERVDRAGDQLLAGAALAADEDGRLARRDAAHRLEHRADRLRLADDLAGRAALDLALQVLVLSLKLLLRLKATQQQGELVGVEGLEQDVLGAVAHRL